MQRRHPWIFSGAVECIDGAPASGDTLPVRDAAGNFLAWAAYNAASQITARVWSWNEKDVIDAAFFRKRIGDALAARRTLGLDRDSNGMRIIHGESDGLPGLIVDKYGDVLVMQLGSAGPEHWRETFADILQELCAPVCIYERSDSDGRELEGLPIRNGIVRGTLPKKVEVNENGLRFAVDVAAGQKTGYYLDQRDNRALTGTLGCRARCAQLLLLHRRFLALCIARRSEVGAVHRLVAGSAATGASQCGIEWTRLRQERNGNAPTCSKRCANCATRTASSI